TLCNFDTCIGDDLDVIRLALIGELLACDGKKSFDSRRELETPHATSSTVFSASRTRSSPEISLGRSVSRSPASTSVSRWVLIMRLTIGPTTWSKRRIHVWV